MSKRPVQETKSQIAYRQESEAKAASEALKLSIQNTARDKRQSGRDAQSTSLSSTRSIVTDTTSLMMSTVQEQLAAAETKITQLKEVEVRYYANIAIDKANKESRELEILNAQTLAAQAQEAAAQAQTKAAETQANLETIRLEALKYAKDNPINSSLSNSTQAPAATKVIQWRLPASQPFFSSNSTETLTIRQWLIATEINLKVSGVTEDFKALVGGAYLRDGPLSRFQALIVKKPNLTWEDLKADLLSAYEPANLAALNYIRLGELTQVTCPTLADYVDKFTRLESQLPSLPESFKISTFVKNLKMELKEKILSNIPNTLEAVIALANSLDVTLLMCKETTPNGFRSFNTLNQGNYQNKHTQEV